ncbi:hypothetical protein I5M27_11415 [Adhaeribacter sp. BT258]|uniref:DUF6970 domain-containing protein n=1 Tax=Adhaeribacter terrigena TaxID=2793070 RepID=A0ABS1C2P9_9BACT|nr:hypothetical protein [Adhaeribacter terrigena]MBK0403598.1 hypothetical protein [Adhaeribacter terrigena]
MMLAYQKSRALLLLFSIAFFMGCQKPNAASQNGRVPEAKTAEPEVPAWLKEKILGFENEKPANPPVSIYSYRYQNQTVYFITGRCCDIPSEVYSVKGQQLCQPDGGFSGKGDMKCPDFFNARTNEKLIWEDLRK